MILACFLALTLAPLALPAQDTANATNAHKITNATVATNALTPPLTDQEILQKLPPEQRPAKMRELIEKRRQEMAKLTPEQRRAKIEEWRQQRAKAAPSESQFAERRSAQVKERIEALRAKKAEGKLTEEEETRLANLERADKVLQERAAAAKAAAKAPTKPAETPTDKPSDRPADRPADKPADKPTEKTEPPKN